jgi:hypothetical protein
VVEVTQEDSVEEFTSPSRLSQFLHYDAFLEKRFSIQVPALTSAQVTTLQTHWVAVQGRAIPFKWVNPADSTTYYVRFDSAKLAFEQIAPAYWSCSFVLRQAHTLEVTEPEA